jgi:hypothetical protein
LSRVVALLGCLALAVPLARAQEPGADAPPSAAPPAPSLGEPPAPVGDPPPPATLDPAPPPATLDPAPPPATLDPASPAPKTVEEAKPAPPSSSSTITGAARLGLYTDSDQTTVFRALAALAAAFGRWSVNASATVDVVSSSSVDVRSSPGLSKVDVVTSASGTTSTTGGNMSDRRLAATAGAGWRDPNGRGINLSASYANERDYNSINAGLNGSIDLFERATTLLAGFTFTYNWIASVLDPTFAQQMYELGWTAGVAQVLTRGDALRLRYDGAAARGYQASPYRNVRFGDWTPSVGDNQRITFLNTIGSADGLPETVPDLRIRHAAVVEWVHSFAEGLGLYSQARLGRDSWGIDSLTAAVELRAATADWRFQLGYRFYIQSGADFYQSKYLLAPTNYTYYTSDKELSREIGHVTNLGVARVLKQAHYPGDTRVLLDGTVNVLYYAYPDFVLLKSRTSGFVELGLTWE